jgi:hypothetical protein
MVSKLIAMGCFLTVQLLGLEPSFINVPFTKKKNRTIDVDYYEALFILSDFGRA